MKLWARAIWINACYAADYILTFLEILVLCIGFCLIPCALFGAVLLAAWWLNEVGALETVLFIVVCPVSMAIGVALARWVFSTGERVYQRIKKTKEELEHG